MRFSKKIKYYRFQTILFWLLLTTGALKSILIYNNIDFDLTLCVFTLVCIDVLYGLVCRNKQIRLGTTQIAYIISLFGFYTLFLLTLFYTPSDSFGYQKVALYLTCILSFVYGLFIIRIDLKLLYKLYLFVYLPIAIWFLIGRNIYYLPYNVGFFGESFLLIKNSYLSFGVGIAIMALLHIHLKKNGYGTLLFTLIILGLGSRGALLFFTMTILIWKHRSILKTMLLKFRIAKQKLPGIVIGVGVLLTIVLTYGNKILGLISTGLYRFQSLFELSKDKSALERIDMFGFAFEEIFGSVKTFLFGNGIGSFGILYNGLDERAWPHNLFIEAWFELGLAGLVILMVLLFSPLIFAKRKGLRFFLVLYIFILLNAMKTGDLVSVWTLYAVSGLIIFKVDVEE